MASETLGRGTSSGVQWVIDYDGISTIGLTTTGSATMFVITLLIRSTSTTYHLDATQYLNQGRVVLGGPGSVTGQTAAILPSAVPPPPTKGNPGSYQFTAGTVGGMLSAHRQNPEAAFVTNVSHAIERTHAATTLGHLPSGVTALLDNAIDALRCAVLASIFAS